ncbi:MAG: ankyrin repeat domain-containing protein [Planctomycetaceae bacterium]|nr:ankyrin repeat domain-containing protein [Planctomycetaceae bacterium]
MLRGCLLALLLYAALAFGYYFWLDTVFDRPGSIYGALGLGLVVFFCLGALMNSRRAFKDWSLLVRAERGMPPRDGKMCAVAGKIYPVGQPLTAPFSGEECVICEYDLSRHRRQVGTSGQENTGSDFAGFLMVPSVVRSQQAEVRILGFPIVEGFRETVASDYASARRAIDYLTTREFESRTGVKIVTVLGVFEDVWSDEDGLVEKNIRLGTVSLPDLFPPELEAAIDRETQAAAERAAGADAATPGEDDLLNREDERLDRIEALDPSADEDDEAAEDDFEDDDEDEDDDDEDDLEDEDDFEDENEDENEDDLEDEELAGPSSADIPRMTEKRIDVAAQVCVVGVYNEMKRGLAPPGRGRHPNRLFCGSAAKVTKVFQSKFQSHLIGGLVFLAVAHLATLGVMQVYLHSDATARDRASAAFEAADKQDFSRLAGLLRRGMDINIRNSSGATLLMEAKDPAVAAWLIERGADVNAVSDDGTTALMAARRAGRQEIVQQLLKAGAIFDLRDVPEQIPE